MLLCYLQHNHQEMCHKLHCKLQTEIQGENKQNELTQDDASISAITPMACATLLNANSTISHCQPSLITRQRASVDSKLLNRPRKYLNDNAQSPLGRFVVYSQLCNKYSDKLNRWSLGLSLSVGGLEHRRCDKQYSTLFIAVHRVRWRIFL